MRLRDLAVATLVVCLPLAARAEIPLLVLRATAKAINPPVRLAGVATTYWRNDGMSGKHLGCVAAARRIFGSNEFRDDLPVIATRDGPACGTAVLVENVRTGRRTWAVKLDTGTWSCYWPNGTRTVEGPRRCVQRGGRRGAVADLSRRIASEIGADGHDPVRLYWW